MARAPPNPISCRRLAAETSRNCRTAGNFARAVNIARVRISRYFRPDGGNLRRENRLLRRHTLTYTGQWVAGLNGAAIVSILLGALAEPQDDGYLAALYRQILNVPEFEFGTSSISGADALDVLFSALTASSVIVLPAILIGIALGALIGAVLSWRRTGWLATPLFHAAGSVPIFCLALLALALFAGAGDAMAARAPEWEIVDFLSAFALPLVWVIALGIAGAIALSIRRAAETALAAPYAENMQRFGLTRAEIVRAYALRHILALTLRDVGAIVLALYTAVVVAEWVFAWPGAGSLFVRSVALEDWRVVAVFVLTLAAARFTAEFLCALAARTIMGSERVP